MDDDGVDLERSDTGRSSLLLLRSLSPGSSTSQDQFAVKSNKGLKMTAFRMMKIWDCLTCHTICEESFAGVEGSPAASAGSSLNSSFRTGHDRSISLRTMNSSRGPASME